MATQEWIQRNQEKMKKYRKEYYHRNRETEKARISKRVKNHLDYVKELKHSGLRCNRCPENHPATLQFHHLDPMKKIGSIGKLISRGLSLDRIKEEIAKCEVVCANCHFKEHYTSIV